MIVDLAYIRLRQILNVFGFAGSAEAEYESNSAKAEKIEIHKTRLIGLFIRAQLTSRKRRKLCPNESRTHLKVREFKNFIQS